METHEKLRYRAWLLAIGADRWYDCTDRIERMKIVEILEEEFARAKAASEPLEKERAFLVNHGIAMSDLPVHVEVPTSQEEQEKVDLRLEEQGRFLFRQKFSTHVQKVGLSLARDAR